MGRRRAVGVGLEIVPPRRGERGGVNPGSPAQELGLRAAQLGPIEMPFRQGLPVRREIYPARLFIDGDKAPVAVAQVSRGRQYQELSPRQGADERSVDGIEVKMLEAVALREPDEPPPVFQEMERVVQVDPGWLVLLEDEVRAARAALGEEQAEVILLPAERLNGDLAAAGEPVEPGQVLVVAALHPGRRGRPEGDDAEADLGIGLAGFGIALAHHALGRGPEIDEGRYGDRRIVRLEISDGPGVRRPAVRDFRVAVDLLPVHPR